MARGATIIFATWGALHPLETLGDAEAIPAVEGDVSPKHGEPYGAEFKSEQSYAGNAEKAERGRRH